MKHKKVIVSIFAFALAISLSTFGYSYIASSKDSIKVGDVNADGGINEADVKLTLMCIHFPDVYQPEGDAKGMSLDFNGDKKVTDDDAAYLLMRVKFKDYYKLPSQPGFMNDNGDIVLPTIKF